MAGPLAGIRVLSFCRMLAGPYASMLLSDLGAEVAKVEEPRMGDMARYAGPFVDQTSSYFLSVNRGKKSVTLDLKNPAARDVVFRMAQRADVLLENFRPGVMERLGLGYEAVRAHNPGIVYASLSGFGQDGPYAQKPAFDMIAQGMGGVLSITGEPGRPPVRVGFSVGDIGASLFAVIAILAALNERSRSGLGQRIDVAMLDAQVALCENAFARYFATGEIPGPTGSRHPLFTPFQAFPTQDGYIVLIAQFEQDWKKFCQAAGKTEWIEDERFRSMEARLEHYAAFVEEMERLMRTRTTREWLDCLEPAGVMCGPVNNIAQVAADPHVRHREMIVEVADSHGNRRRVVGTPMKFARTPCRIERASPELGEHTDSILSEWAGLTPEEIAALRQKGVV
jgi:CoA:oxalate CoA-transferase